MAATSHSIGVAYLLRGGDPDWVNDCQRFVNSYLNFQAGINHQIYVILKGFACADDESYARKLISPLHGSTIEVADNSFDIGAYQDWALQISEDLICFLNTGSEILSDCWLHKLHMNLLDKDVGIVGATGSFERFGGHRLGFPKFPNPHIRTTACMLDRKLYLDATHGKSFEDKMKTYLFESGHQSLTRIVKKLGLRAVIVGRNGRGYNEKHWAISGTFRQGDQSNLLIGDRHTRGFNESSWTDKCKLTNSAWGTLRSNCTLYRWC